MKDLDDEVNLPGPFPRFRGRGVKGLRSSGQHRPGTHGAEVGQAAVDLGRHVRQQAGKLHQQPRADEVRRLVLDQLGDARSGLPAAGL